MQEEKKASLKTQVQTPLIYEARADFLKAIAHPGRLQMIDILSQGEKCVCEIAQATGYDISTASRYLAQMKRAAIVSDRKQGTSVYYSLRLCCINDLFRCMEEAISQRLDREERLCALPANRDTNPASASKAGQ